MKREIKFRSAFFDAKTDKFSYFAYWGFIDHKNESSQDCFKAPAQSSHHIRKFDDQFTGLKDRNGKEIYEGDILIAMTENIGNMIIFFEDGAFYCKNKYSRWGLLSRGFEIKEYSPFVIGNIYENPELLK